MVLILLEHKDGKIKKASLEAASLASQLSTFLNCKTIGIISKGANELNQLGQYGLDQIYEFSAPDFLDTHQWIQVLTQAYSSLKADYFVFSNTSLGKSIGGALSVKLNTGLISNVIALKLDGSKPIFKKSVFSGKAFAWYSFNKTSGIISVMPHGFGILADKSKQTEVLQINLDIPQEKIRLRTLNLIKGKTPLTEADIVVSAGRGLKDPSNWTMIEELADILNAATACSRPVADAGWRPHHEHVGQTGIAIRPNVYIAIGISGAIQHLAGVNNSKKIIVINKDSEAPFFKAADYGICGDLFEIIPKLNEALKKAK